MVNAISNNSLIAALFGAGAAQPLRSTSGASTQGSAQPTRSTDGHAQPVDTIDISLAGERADAPNEPQGTQESQSGDAPKGLGGETQLTDEEQQQVKELKQRDAEVRRHESAHMAAAGSNAAGGPTFEYTTGPDGKRYAVGGEVQIDTSAVDGDPQATIQKMQQIRRAALAPASPSGQDRAVAAQAAATERGARAELAEERRASASDADDPQSGPTVAIDATGATAAAGVTDSSNNSSKHSDATSRPKIATEITQDDERIGEILDVIA